MTIRTVTCQPIPHESQTLAVYFYQPNDVGVKVPRNTHRKAIPSIAMWLFSNHFIHYKLQVEPQKYTLISTQQQEQKELFQTH